MRVQISVWHHKVILQGMEVGIGVDARVGADRTGARKRTKANTCLRQGRLEPAIVTLDQAQRACGRTHFACEEVTAKAISSDTTCSS
jgi:hypothetical protein